MSDYRLSLRTTHNHPDIIVSLEDGLDFGVEWLFDYFKNAIENGGEFKSDQTVQIGWMIVKLQKDIRGDLEIWEPRLDFMPIKWTRGASNTFRQMSVQRELSSQLGSEPQFPSIMQSGVLPKDFFDVIKDFKMTRDAPSGKDSGWVFAKTSVIDLDCKLASLFEIAMNYPAVIPFLSLPPGSFVEFKESDVVVSFGSKTISSDSNEFLMRVVRNIKGLPKTG